MEVEPQSENNPSAGEAAPVAPAEGSRAPEASPGRRIRWWWVIAWGGLILLLAFLGLGLVRSQQGPVGPGQRAPDYVLTTFDGQEIASQDLAGKVVVINFWASWCKPCEREAADLQTAWEQYGAQGEVVFLGVDYVDTEPEALRYLEKFQITYPNGPDLGTRISQSFRIQGVPETYFIDKEGVLTYVQKGPFLSLDQIQAVIDPLVEN